MNRLGGRPLLIVLVGAGVLMTAYSLTLLPIAVTLLVVGLVAIGGASAWLYGFRTRDPAEVSTAKLTQPEESSDPIAIADVAEVSEPIVIADVAEVSEPIVIADVSEISEPIVIADVAEVSEPIVIADVAEVSEPSPVGTVTLLPEQWEMLQRWMEMAAQPQLVADTRAPPEVVVLPDPAATTTVSEPHPAAQEETPRADAPAAEVEEQEKPAPAPRDTPPARRSQPVFAQATTYQDGEITKRSQITLRLSGRRHR